MKEQNQIEYLEQIKAIPTPIYPPESPFIESSLSLTTQISIDTSKP